jgi:hypothetical protein
VIRGPVGISLLAGSVAVALRLPFLHDAPYPDEGGLLVVAAHWHAGGPFLYGRFFVDRPPLLLTFFRLAVATGGLVALRVLGLLLVVAAVACAGRAGARLGGSRGAVAAAVVCASLLADPRLGTREIDAETVGVPLVLLAAALTLEAVRRTRAVSRGVLLVSAGAAGACALLVKQDLADGLVFAVTLVAAGGVHTVPRRQVASRVGLVLLGAALPLVGALAWSSTTTGARGLWYALYGFRIASSASLFATGSAAQLARLNELGRSALLSGMVLVLVVSVAALLRRRPDPASIALAAMLAAEAFGVAGGGYYWSHYLIGLVPATALLAARAIGSVGRPGLLGLLVAGTLVSATVEVAVLAQRPTPVDQTQVGALAAWLNQAERPGDEGVVLYGEADVFEATRLRPAYPYLWTLPQRVLDPHLTRLVHTLARPDRPTFVVVTMPLDSWGQDPHGRVSRVLTHDYRVVSDVCGDSVYVRRGARRPNPAPSTCR